MSCKDCKDCKCDIMKEGMGGFRFVKRLENGGYINEHPLMTYKERMNDSIRSQLAVGTLVIPVKHVPLVLGQFPELLSYREDTSKLPKVQVVVMPHEIAVPPSKAPEVIRFLKSKGINLPNT